MAEEFLALEEKGNFQDAVRLAQERVAESEKEFGRERRFSFKVFLGVLLIGYAGVMLGFRRLPNILWGGRVADGMVGFGSGALGGLAGLSGVLPTIWCGLRGWNADAQRAVYQPFNLTILAIVLCTYITQGTMTREVWALVFMCIPATILGAYLGIRMYGRVNDQQFRAMVLLLLLVSGIVLTVSNLT